MEAGDARSRATTSARSSTSAGAERSTMRAATGLSSGMRFRDQLLDGGEGIAPVPVALAEDPVAHLPRAIDDERHGKALRIPRVRRLLGGIEEHRKLDARLPEERLHLLR